MTAVAPAAGIADEAAPTRHAPYQGLAPYSTDDAEYFFGRDAWCGVIIDYLLAYRISVLYGASGVGKSSVVRAGVAYELEKRARRSVSITGKPEIVPVVFSAWSGDSAGGLKLALRESVAAVAPDDAQAPPSGPLADVLLAWGERLGASFAVMLDQFDEYFIYHRRDGGPSSFIAELAEAVTRRDVPANFLISIREDALAGLDCFDDRIPDLWSNLLRIENLDHEAAREAIEGPVARWNEQTGSGIELEPGLVEAVLAEADARSVHVDKAGRGVLQERREDDPVESVVEAPYLQLVMSRLWEEEARHGSRVLRIATLTAMGGANEIIRRHFDAVMRSLPRRQRAVAARIFEYLVTPSGTKIALPPAALAKWGRQKEPRVAAALEKLASGDHRILRTVASPGGEDEATAYEIFHDRLAGGILDWRARYVRRRMLKRIVAGVLLVFVVGGTASGYTINQQQDRNADLQSQLEPVAQAAKRSPYFVALLPTHRVQIYMASFSRDGSRIVTAGADGIGTGSAIVSSADTGKKLRVIPSRLRVARAVFSPDGKEIGLEIIAIAPIRAWAGVWGRDGKRFKRLFTVRASAWYASLAFTPDGRLLVTALDNGTAHLWDAHSGKSVATLRKKGIPISPLEHERRCFRRLSDVEVG